MEPLDLPEHWGWSDAMEVPPAEWWVNDEPVWEAPELDLGDGTILILDAGNPFPPDGFDAFPDDSDFPEPIRSLHPPVSTPKPAGRAPARRRRGSR